MNSHNRPKLSSIDSLYLHYPKIKICGLTRTEDIIKCGELGVDAVGFLLKRKSTKTNYHTDLLPPTQAAKLISETPAKLATVLLIHCPDYKTISDLVHQICPSALQLQNQSLCPDTTKKLKVNFPDVELIKTVHIKDKTPYEYVEYLQPYIEYVDAILLDSAKGGSGHTHDWQVSKEIRACLGTVPVILAGGLNEKNVETAIKTVKPHAVDVMSSVNIERGIKDQDKISAFVSSVHRVSDANINHC